VSDVTRRSWWLIAAGVCIGTLLALVGVRYTTPQVFEARSAVALDLDKLPREDRRWDDAIDLRDLRKALLSDAALHYVIVRTFPGPSSREAEQDLADCIRSQLSMSYSRLSRKIEFRYRDSDPDRAAEVVNLFARFLGGIGIDYLAAPSAAPVFPQFRDYLAAGVVGGLLGGLLVLIGRLLARVAVAVRVLTLKALS